MVSFALFSLIVFSILVFGDSVLVPLSFPIDVYVLDLNCFFSVLMNLIDPIYSCPFSSCFEFDHGFVI